MGMFRVVLVGPMRTRIVENDSLDFDALGLSNLPEVEREKIRSEYRALYTLAKYEPVIIPAFLITERGVRRIDRNVALDANGRVTFSSRVPRICPFD